LARHAQTPFAGREVTAMKKLMGALFWLATAAVALVPVMNMQHNETLVRDDR
jgi:hypothetical protein